MPGFPVDSCFSSAILGSVSGVLRTGETQSWSAPLNTTGGAPIFPLLS